MNYRKNYSVSVIVPADRGDSFNEGSFFKKMNLSYKFRKFYNLLQRGKVHLNCPWIEVSDFNLPVVEVPDLSEKYISDADVIIDLRQDSQTYRKWFFVELSENNYKTLYIPEGFAHGFQTLEDNTVVFYQMSEFYHPECARGVRWNDPVFGIKWPENVTIISERDKNYCLYNRKNY